MNEIIAILLIIAAAVLALLAILMPIFVFIICNHCEKMSKTLAAMEQMMRNGK